MFFLFPGQGSQTPGMGKDFYKSSPEARQIFDEAAAMGPEGFLNTLFEGSADDLKDTRVAQPALLTVEVAIARHIAAKGITPSGCAGHSLGEIPALVVAGACEFGPAFELTTLRARLMTEDVPGGGMAAVMGLAPEAIEAALSEGAQVANYNGPQQTIISGSDAALEAAEAALKEAGAKRVLRLPVSGPFHSEYMRPAAEKFAEALAKVAFTPPAVRFVSSVAAAEVTEPEEIRALLAQQLCAPVRWTEVMGCVNEDAALEVGPGRVLQGLAKRIDGAPSVTLAGTLEDIEAL